MSRQQREESFRIVSAPIGICLISGNHLCHNPRVLKEADTLSAAGYRIQVLGAALDRDLAAADRKLMTSRDWTFTPVVDMTRESPSDGARTLLRARTKGGRILGQTLGLENHWQLGYCAPELLSAARKSDASLFIAHSEQALWVVNALHRDGRATATDMEDWFSEDLLPEAREERPIALLRTLEAQTLRTARHASCTSTAMSRALAVQYECAPPAVIYNAFAWSDRQSIDASYRDRRDRSLRSIHWYSQTIGPGRGLEDLLPALASVRADVEIHLRGNLPPASKAWLDGLIEPRWRERIYIHPLVPNEELLSRIAEHDIGFAGEMTYCRSRELTVTNKILHYLLAGLAVVASNTPGHLEVADAAPGAVLTYVSGDRKGLAERINALLSSPDCQMSAQQSALRAAERTFCWEKQRDVLLQSVSRALDAPAETRKAMR